MSTQTSYTELVMMQEQDLQREIVSQQATVRKLKIGILMQKEKDTALYRREKTQLARMKTALTQVQSGTASKSPKPLKKAKKSTTVRAPSA